MADILHPFASLKWKNCQKLPVEMKDATAVWHEEKLTIMYGYLPYIMPSRSQPAVR